MRRTIGGEFEIDPGAFRLINTSGPTPMAGFWYASGRSALYHILLHSKLHYNTKRILLPEWLCSSMLDVVKLAEISYEYYILDQKNLPDLNFLSIKEGDLIVVVNYFGLQDIEPTIAQLKTVYPQLIVVSDLVQAYFEMEKESCADYRYTSLRKTFAVPDGGWVLSKFDNLEQPTSNNYFSEHKLAGAVLKYESLKTGWIDDFQFLQLLENGEKMIGQSHAINSTISWQSSLLYGAVDRVDCANRRRQNARYIIERLADIGISPIITASNDKSVPLFIPIELANRDLIRTELRKNSIFCPVHWPVVDPKLKKGRFMAEKELSVVIDHRYDENQLEPIVEIIRKWL